ncbi:hypothetical protein CDL15_Pgr022385 [Punica granatum]|uniref:Uncharacterized protein n=1 Tax=Punica granatum TaxID=22663 RepID=A0A218XR39_PUNGR|nr:hypothetical protein CDL15_Pgr022385 [Punica granatum]
MDTESGKSQGGDAPWGSMRICHNEVASSVLCPWGGGVFDLSEAGFAARAMTRYSTGCQLCRSGDCSSLEMPWSCDEGLKL